METFVNALNTVGKTFVDFSLSMLIQSAALIVVLLVLDLLLRKKVQAVFRYFLWLLVLAKLLLPTSFSAPTSLAYWLGDRLPAVAVQPASPPADVPPLTGPVIDPAPAETIAANPAPAMAPAAPINNETLGEAAALPQPPAPAPAAIPAAIPAAAAPMANFLSWQAMVFIVWLAVAAAMVLLLLQRFFFVRGLIAQAGPAGEDLTGLLNECRTRMGLTHPVTLKLSPNAASPSVCGLLHPVILLPQGLSAELDGCHLKAILLHELAHIKRGDLWVSLIQTLLQIAYFYHPLLWLANLIIRRLREQAVDEMVLVALGEQAGEYPETLLDVSRLSFTRPALSLRLIGVVESKSTLAARIKHILSRPYPKSARLGLAGLLAIIVAAAVLLPMAKAAYEQPEFIIKGTVTDAQTGQPIAGAKVGDNQKYNEGKFYSFTDPNGHYEYKTWYEEHNTTAEADGYQTQQKGFATKLFGSEKEKVINYELTLQESTAPSSFSATLPNGATVTLIGVCESPSDGKQWWRPDGSLLETVPYNELNVSVPTDPDRRNLKLAVHIEKAGDKGSIGFRIEIPQSQGYGIGAARKDEQTVPNLQGVLFDLPLGDQAADVHIGVAAGQWTTTETRKPDFNGTISTQTMIWNGPITQDDRTALHVAYRESDLESRIVAVDKSGNIQTGSSTSGGKDAFISAQIIFRIPLSEIAEFQFQTRPYQWVTFQNVSLQPGRKTDVQIEIGKTDKDPQAVKRPNPMAGYMKMMMGGKPKAEKVEGESPNPEASKSVIPPGIIGTWFFNNPEGDDEQMAIFPDGRIVVLYSNGHRDETRFEDGKVALAEYGTTAELELRPDEKMYQHFTVKGAESVKIWNKINPEPQTELLRPLTEPKPNAAAPSEPNLLFDQDPIVRQLKEKITEIKIEILELSVKYSQEHPVIKNRQKLLDDYQKQLDRRQNELRLLALLRQQQNQHQQEMLKQSFQNPTAQLPNGVTVELVGFSHWTDGKLQWFSPSGSPIQIPDVTAADIDGLGSVIALCVTPSDPEDWLYVEYNLGAETKEIKNWHMASSDIWLLALGEDRRFINLAIAFYRMAPWQKKEIPLNFKDVISTSDDGFKISRIDQHGISVVRCRNLGEIGDSSSFEIIVIGDKKFDLGDFVALDKNGKIYETSEVKVHKFFRPMVLSPRTVTKSMIFNFPWEDLKGIIGQTRKALEYKIVFNNISLLPGQKSDVKIEIETPAQPDEPNEVAVSLPDDVRADTLARMASAKRRATRGIANGPQVSFECRILSIIDKKQVQNFLQEKEITQENPPNLIISDQDREHLTQLTKTHKKSGFLEGPHFTVFSGEEAEISFAGGEKRPGFFLKALPIVLEDTNRVNLSFEASEIRTDNSPPQTIALETEMESGQILLVMTPEGFFEEYHPEQDHPDSTVLLLIKSNIILPDKITFPSLKL